MGTEATDQGVTQKIEISDRVENLVLDELVTVAKAVIVNHPEVIHDDGVIQTAAARESSFLQRLHILEESKCSSATDLLGKGNLG